MFDNFSVLPGVGQAHVDHVCIQVGPDMIIAATCLFTKLGYVENQPRRKNGEWGEARFMEKLGSIPVQLTLSTDMTVILPGENHVAIAVENPYKAAMSLVEWLNWAGIKDTVVEDYDEKYFVSIPTILVEPLEFVPMH